eukprot:GHVT01032915.1.p1 GENE.GHVT01032915.1~~GHVT01032915.1.p1  ORF type:complete len:340 (+),score=50.46 GHVT01032915.1:572-1591(+)
MMSFECVNSCVADCVSFERPRLASPDETLPRTGPSCDPNVLPLSPTSNKNLEFGIWESSRNPCSLVVDCGFSCCHAVPFYEYTPILPAALRSDLGGTHLNAYLKNLMKFRSINLEQNELLVQHIKEESCFVSPTFTESMSLAHQELSQARSHKVGPSTHLYYECKLPDFEAKKKDIANYFRRRRTNSNSSCQSHGEEEEAQNETNEAATSREFVPLNNERISVPELLFNPQDVDKSKLGLPELIQRAILKSPPAMQPYLSEQIFLVGGSSKFVGLKERLWKDLRSTLPQEFRINIYSRDSPEFSAWVGASEWSREERIYRRYSIPKVDFFDKGGEMVVG